MCALLRCPWFDGPGIPCFYVSLALARSLARSPFTRVCARFSASFNGAMMRVLVLWRRRRKKGKTFFLFFVWKRGVFKNEKREKNDDRSIDRSTGTRFSRYSWRAKKSTSSVFVVEQKSRSFFFVLFCVSRAQKRERNAERARISKNNFSRSAFPSLLEHAFTRGRERERERKTRAADPTRAFFQRKTRRRR